MTVRNSDQDKVNVAENTRSDGANPPSSDRNGNSERSGTIPPSKKLVTRSASRSPAHLPVGHLNRVGAVDSAAPLMRVTPVPIPRLDNPAHNYLDSLQSAAGARSRMYLLNNVARMFGAHDYEHLHWEDLRTPTVRRIMAVLRDADYSPTSRNAYLSAIKATAREAWLMNLMDLEVLEKIRSLKPVRFQKKPSGRAHSIEVLKTLIHAARTDGTPTAKRNALIISFMATLGIRREEVTKIMLPQDINFSARDIEIHGKGNKERTLSLPAPVWESLLDYLATERGYDAGALFCPYWNNRTQPRINSYGLDVSVINYVLNKARKRCADLLGEPVTPHDLRRSFATMMEKKGMTIREIQILLGHASSATTEIYLRDDKDGYRKKASEMLGDDFA